MDTTPGTMHYLAKRLEIGQTAFFKADHPARAAVPTDRQPCIFDARRAYIYDFDAHAPARVGNQSLTSRARQFLNILRPEV